jgi:hypothetical protein
LTSKRKLPKPGKKARKTGKKPKRTRKPWFRDPVLLERWYWRTVTGAFAAYQRLRPDLQKSTENQQEKLPQNTGPASPTGNSREQESSKESAVNGLDES